MVDKVKIVKKIVDDLKCVVHDMKDQEVEWLTEFHQEIRAGDVMMNIQLFDDVSPSWRERLSLL